MPKEDKDRHREEFEALLAIFEKFINNTSSVYGPWEVMEELMSLRAEFAIHYAFDGFGMEYSEALELLRQTEEGLTEEDKAKRDIIVAAVDNLVDFAVAEEYQMASELSDIDEIDEDDDEEILAIFDKYNNRYALIENQDIKYAMMVAAQLVLVDNATSLTYMTQGDERVRPWHLQYEGFTALKSKFPGWLVPPIEHACRCYLVEDSVFNKASNISKVVSEIPQKPQWFNPTFKECVAFGGRIFSDEHPYFMIDKRHQEILEIIANRIKNKYWNG